jgi:hypothetical protein
LITNQSKIFNYREFAFLPRNMETFVSIDRESVKNLGSYYSNCRKDLKNWVRNDIYDYFESNKKYYTRKDCVDYAIQKEIKKECGCISLNVFEFGIDAKYCNKSQNGCEIKFFSSFDDRDASICPFECDSFKYISKTSLNSFTPTSDIYNNLKRIENDTYFNDFHLKKLKKNSSLYYIHFYYDESYVTEIIETAKYTWINLISNLGGTLGLFLGMSLLSFVEIFEFLFKALIIILQGQADTVTPSQNPISN